MCDEVLRIITLGEHGNPDADRDGVDDAVMLEPHRFDGAPQPLGDVVREIPSDIAKKHDELVAAEAREKIARPELRLEQ